MDTYKAIMCGDKSIKLKYNARAFLEIEKFAGKRVGQANIDMINATSGLKLRVDDKIPLELVLSLIDTDMEVMFWIWGLGLGWSDAGAKPADVPELYDAYMADVTELDEGDHLREFKLAALEAIGMARGLDIKKLQVRNVAAQEKAKVMELKQIYKAQMLAKEEIEAEKMTQNGTGEELGKPVVDSLA